MRVIHLNILFADFESTLANCDDEYDGLTKEEMDKMATKKYHKQQVKYINKNKTH